MNLELINNKIQEMLPEKRYKHSLNVADCEMCIRDRDKIQLKRVLKSKDT